MGEQQQPEYYREEDLIDLGMYFGILRKNWWKILSLSLLAGVITLSILFLMPNKYKATAVIAPASEKQENMPAIGALAASFGIQLGGPTKVEDLEALFNSKDLTGRVFTRHDHWIVLLGKKYDPATGMVNPGVFGFLLEGKKEPKPPSEWDAIRDASKAMTVAINRKSGTLTLSFESTSPDASAAILRNYLDEAKSRLQEEAFDRALKNKKFIEEQIGKTVDALTRDRLYSLLGQEVEREMMARNREQFGFRVIDSPRIPDRKSKPNRALSALMVVMFSGFALSIYFFARERRKLLTAVKEHGKHEELS